MRTIECALVVLLLAPVTLSPVHQLPKVRSHYTRTRSLIFIVEERVARPEIEPRYPYIL